MTVQPGLFSDVDHYTALMQENQKYHFAEFLPISGKKILFVDTETNGLSRFKRLVGVGIMDDDEVGVYAPVRHALGLNMPEAPALAYVKTILEDPSSEKVFFNLKFDLGMLAKEGIAVQGTLHDAMVMASLLNENRPSYKLKALAHEDCGMPPDEKNILVDWLKMNGYKPEEIWKAPSDLVGPYCYGDCLRTKRLWHLYREKVLTSSLAGVYRTECRIIPTVLLSELHGVRVDVDALERAKVELGESLESRNRVLCDMVGAPAFNYNSALHLEKYFGEQGISSGKTDKGNPCWDDHALAKVDHPAARIVQELREKEKLMNFVCDYVDRQKAGRIYPSFHTLRGEKGGAVTGRMSSSNPNMQNVPPEARHFFVPDPGFVWLSLDYSQLEYRIFAHYAQDKRLMDAYLSDPWTDFHQVVADMMEVPRKKAKNINFGLLYAMGKSHLCEVLGLDPANADDIRQADDLFRRYHSEFPATQRLRRDVERVGLERGYIRNLFGRTRSIKAQYSYKYLNSLISGSAADLFKRGIEQCALACARHGATPLLYVHDEIVVQVRPESVEPFLKEAIPALQDFPQCKVPMRVEVEYHRWNWGRHEKVQVKWNGQPPYAQKDLEKCDGLIVYE